MTIFNDQKKLSAPSAPEFIITDEWSCQSSPFPNPPSIDPPLPAVEYPESPVLHSFCLDSPSLCPAHQNLLEFYEQGTCTVWGCVDVTMAWASNPFGLPEHSIAPGQPHPLLHHHISPIIDAPRSDRRPNKPPPPPRAHARGPVEVDWIGPGPSDVGRRDHVVGRVFEGPVQTFCVRVHQKVRACGGDTGGQSIADRAVRTPRP